MSLPNISLGTDGSYLNGITLFVSQKASSLIFKPVEAENAMIFQISNIKSTLRVKDFYYKLWIVPLRGFLNANMDGIFFNVKI